MCVFWDHALHQKGGLTFDNVLEAISQSGIGSTNLWITREDGSYVFIFTTNFVIASSSNMIVLLKPAMVKEAVKVEVWYYCLTVWSYEPLDDSSGG